MRFVIALMLLGTGTWAPVAPRLLSETGLYQDGPGQVVDARNRPFSPQYPLWSDGASKRRWVRLPEGSAIDVANINRWEFPVGTRFWKEFAFQGRKVETRFLWKAREDTWVFASYAWNSEQTDAALAPDTGTPNVVEIAAGRRHSIPSIADCRACHDSSRTEILGFDALQLSNDRDPGALHTEPLGPEMVTLRTFVDEGLLRPRRTDLVTAPPRIEAATPEARAALGYLSTNCGNCHNRESSIASLGLILKHAVDDVRRARIEDVRRAGGEDVRRAGALAPAIEPAPCTPALATTVGRKGHWVVPSNPDESRVIHPGRPDLSSLVQRARSRRPSSQMPPIGTVVQDKQAVDLLTTWVASSPDEWAKIVARCTGG